MADDTDDSEKTEDPTQKRLKEAHDKGDVPKSQEVSTWFTLAGATLMIAIFAPGAAASLGELMSGYLEHAHQIPVDGYALKALWRDTGQSVALIVGVPLIALVLMAVAGNLIQHQPLFTGETIKPKLSKVSPASGFKRLFSADSLVNFTKGMLKISIVGAVMVAVMWPHRDEAEIIIFAETSVILQEARVLILQLLAAILAVMTVVAGADFIYQKNKWFNKQKMTLREVKEEYKQTEGDPQVKGKIRQLRMERSRKRMMSAVPQATVVVTNPTHYAVALKYEEGMGAPLCLAKGTDAIALKMREIARENEIPVVENPPLARALYATVDIDREVPEEHYKAVAEVIGFVYRMRRRASWRAN
ncbi:flagellar biosynthetic protein FlhB [Labrenzia sp. EL_208]|uniref:flagellar biosynthesis protein FlhB n=1 Tax=Roseibium album TaxID=311410 RepID=UPI000CF06312|nr:flagellar biosynthesis protein FlhB [Roseibium album]MBG6143151.1 flagellar biosynthetic protein FlhB [Labrenzia sp. EL_142]MBG6172361.1 flagellar biosynthetic protein FlhB [Labrenzia sp. EL_132]MBG6203472.1 flagellar biosynthetic protein FlhB [Labrenzia sp. EL_13]MBG6205952.1 flagellar biosynthetic protein FlhB [Labrenzia sp. EL_126]MBG6227421.1 flagellar biosynthetic protein FlhB [Labrenzia sp. EL_208]MCR9058898.1 flagellar biosynthesis protein FlhB [Paracoccaceae bacterium]